MTDRLTPGFRRALLLLWAGGAPGLWPEQFAGHMWPGRAWRAGKPDGGPSPPAVAAGFLLGRLGKLGLCYRAPISHGAWKLTALGRKTAQREAPDE